MVRWQLTDQAYLDRNVEEPFFYIIVKLHLFFKKNKIVLVFYVISCWALHLSLVFSRFYIHCFLGFLTLFLSADNLCKQLVPRALVLIRIQTIWHSDSSPERCFEKNILKKNQRMTTKVLNSPSVQRVITFRLIEIIHVSTCVLLNKRMQDWKIYIHVYIKSRIWQTN